MKNKLTVTALGLALAGGSLSAQLNPPTVITQMPGEFFANLNAAMFQAQDGLYVPDFDGPNTLPTGAAVFDSFSFVFEGSAILDTIINPSFVQNAQEPAGPGQTSLFFELIQPNNPEAFVAFDSFNIGFFGENAGIRNRVYVRDLETDPATDTLYFDFTAGGPPPQTNSALSYVVTPQSVPAQSEFFIWNQHLGPQPGAPGDSNWQPQELEINWRIFKMTASTLVVEEDGFVAGDLDVTRDPNGGVYILMLDDRFPEDQDWDDGFVLLSGFVAEVPEPSVIGVAAVVGLGGLIWFRRRKSSKVS